MISVLHVNNFAAPVMPLEGFTARTMLALIRDETLTYRQVVVMAHAEGSRGLANCLTLWLCQIYTLAGHGANAWIIAVPGMALAALWPDCAWPERKYCWAVEDFGGAQPVAVLTGVSPRIAARLQRWPKLAKNVALHEVLMINARAPILRVGPDQYALIDGSQLFGGEHWTRDTLRRTVNATNWLARAAGMVDALGIPSAEHAAEVRASATEFRRMLCGCVELASWLPKLLPTADAEELVQLICKRATLEYTRWDCDRTSSNDSMT